MKTVDIVVASIISAVFIALVGGRDAAQAWGNPVAYVPLVPSVKARPQSSPSTPTKRAIPTNKSSRTTSAAKIDFETQVKPIFVATCISCHGPESQKGKLRLDSRQLALQGGFAGPSIVPGSSEKSYLVKRILGAGDEDRMPLKHPPLTAQQIAVIRKWIDQGAVWTEKVAKPQAKAKQH